MPPLTSHSLDDSGSSSEEWEEARRIVMEHRLLRLQLHRSRRISAECASSLGDDVSYRVSVRCCRSDERSIHNDTDTDTDTAAVTLLSTFQQAWSQHSCTCAKGGQQFRCSHVLALLVYIAAALQAATAAAADAHTATPADATHTHQQEQTGHVQTDARKASEQRAGRETEPETKTRSERDAHPHPHPHPHNSRGTGTDTDSHTLRVRHASGDKDRAKVGAPCSAAATAKEMVSTPSPAVTCARFTSGTVGWRGATGRGGKRSVESHAFSPDGGRDRKRTRKIHIDAERQATETQSETSEERASTHRDASSSGTSGDGDGGGGGGGGGDGVDSGGGSSGGGSGGGSSCGGVTNSSCSRVLPDFLRALRGCVSPRACRSAADVESTTATLTQDADGNTKSDFTPHKKRARTPRKKHTSSLSTKQSEEVVRQQVRTTSEGRAEKAGPEAPAFPSALPCARANEFDTSLGSRDSGMRKRRESGRELGVSAATAADVGAGVAAGAAVPACADGDDDLECRVSALMREADELLAQPHRLSPRSVRSHRTSGLASESTFSQKGASEARDSYSQQVSTRIRAHPPSTTVTAANGVSDTTPDNDANDEDDILESLFSSAGAAIDAALFQHDNNDTNTCAHDSDGQNDSDTQSLHHVPAVYEPPLSVLRSSVQSNGGRKRSQRTRVQNNFSRTLREHTLRVQAYISSPDAAGAAPLRSQQVDLSTAVSEDAVLAAMDNVLPHFDLLEARRIKREQLEHRNQSLQLHLQRLHTPSPPPSSPPHEETQQLHTNTNDDSKIPQHDTLAALTCTTEDAKLPAHSQCSPDVSTSVGARTRFEAETTVRKSVRRRPRG